MVTTHLFRTYRYDLRLTRAQEEALAQVMEAERLLYNAALQEWQESYRWATQMSSILGLARFDRSAIVAIGPEGLDDIRQSLRQRLLAWKTPDWFSQDASLTLNAQRAVLGEIVLDAPCCRRRWTLDRVHGAIKGFYERIKNGETPGFPRYRRFGRWRSFGFKEMSGVTFEIVTQAKSGKRGRGYLMMKGLKSALKVSLHRSLPNDADIRSCSITRGPKGWTVNLAIKIPAAVGIETQDQLADVVIDQVMGVDLGIAALAATDDGLILDGLAPARKAHGRVRRRQREASRATCGSNNARKKCKASGRELRRIKNERRTKHRQEAARLVSHALERNVRVIAFEDLSLQKMTRSANGTVAAPGTNVRQKAGLNRSLLDAGLNQFLGHVRCKAESAGIRIVLVNPRKTSIRCSGCGRDVPKALSVRTHRCGCGLTLNRDVNAARNIARLGVEALAA